MAISIQKELRNQSSYSVLGFNSVAHSFLFLQRIFQVLSHCDWVAILIFESQCKISQYPEEARKILSHLVSIRCFLTSLDLQGLRQVYDQGEIVQCVLVDWPHTIINQQRAEQQSQQEYFGVVVLLLVECSKSLSVDDYDWHFLFFVSCAIKYFFPDPKPLRASINGRADCEAHILCAVLCHLLFLRPQCFKKQLIQQIGFSRPIFAAHRNNSNFALNLAQKLDSFWSYHERGCFGIKLDERNSHAGSLCLLILLLLH